MRQPTTGAPHKMDLCRHTNAAIVGSVLYDVVLMASNNNQLLKN